MMEPLLDSNAHLNPLVAVKTMNRKLANTMDYMRVKEVRFILSVPSHHCLVQIYEMFVDEVDLQLCIVMESMNQNLYQLMKQRKNIRFSSVTLKSILRQLTDGLRHIHRHGFFHRDLKPENILVISTSQYYGCKENIPISRKDDNYVVKIADYGLARHVQNMKPYTAYVSTRWYRSPEILLRRKWYSKPVDIWALGTVAVEIATFRPLFPGSNELDQTWKILEVLGCPSVGNQPFRGDDKQSTGNTNNLIQTLLLLLQLLLLLLLKLSMNDSLDDFTPFGGYWEEAQTLSSKLGFILPATLGSRIEDILPGNNYDQLGKIIKMCLTWNPDTRADIETICAQEYFQGTCLASPYREPERLFDGKENLNHMREPKNLKLENNDENKDPIERIQPMVVSVSKEKEIVNNYLGHTCNVYDDDNDGYELEFMKSLTLDDFQEYSFANNFEETMASDKEGCDIEDYEAYINYDEAELATYRANSGYSWENDAEDESIDNDPEDMQEDSRQVDYSFGSGYDIKC